MNSYFVLVYKSILYLTSISGEFMEEKNKSMFTIKNFIYVILLGLIISIFILKPFSQAHLYNNEPNNNYYSTVTIFCTLRISFFSQQ